MKRPLWPRVLIACGLWLVLQAAQAAQAASAMHGLPLVRHFGVGDLPAAPFYSDIAVDTQGTLYVGSSEGVMVFRSGLWELFELPHRAPAYTLLAASDGRLYVGGRGVLGELHREPDGSLRFIDLQAKFTDDDDTPLPSGFYGLLETARGVLANDGRTLYLLRRDGSTTRQKLPAGAGQRLFVADGALYVHVAGIGVCRIDDAGVSPLPGTKVLDHLGVNGVWAWHGGLLYAAKDGFHFGDASGVRKLASDADAAFAAHAPYGSTRLPNGDFVFGGYDGSLMRFSSDLRLLDSFPLDNGVLDGFGMDRDGGLWAAGEFGLVRLTLPSPWTVYDQRHGLKSRLKDSAWYDGALWVAALGLWRAEPTVIGGVPRFLPQPWLDTRMEVFTLLGTDAGLLIGDRYGLMVLDRGAKQSRRLVDPQLKSSAYKLIPSTFDATRVLVLGGSGAWWLAQRDGHWQVAASWPMSGTDISGFAQTAPGEFWMGDERGGAHRWRLDPQTGQLREQRHFGTAEGLLSGKQQGTHLVRIDETLYALSDRDVRKLAGERFVPASLPVLPGLERPWELEVTTTALGSFAWTTRKLWWRHQGETAFLLQQVDSSRMPGFRQLALQGDGRLRLVARDSVLEFDPELGQPAAKPLHARLDRIQLRQPDSSRNLLLPLQPVQMQVLPPGSGLGLRFGLETMAPEVEFRYRLSGYRAEWSSWSTNRDLGYRRLPPGDYRFELQARIRGGRQVEPLVYALRVEPYWYERGVVQALFWIAGVLLIAWALHARSRRVIMRNRELERRIAERTRELETANLRLTELAIVDGLTGIANRHAMERALLRGWQRCSERGEPLAVVMADVDHFKQFNDSHGHQVGDTQLQRVAAALAAEVSSVDELAARYGGEEFVLILPGVGSEAARLRAEQVRQRAEQAMAAAGLPGSISLGVAATVPVAGGDPAWLVRCADEALYRAKRGGRNRVECTDEADFTSS